VPGIGYCSNDRTRRPLRGDELRGCWEAPEAARADPPATERPAASGPAAPRRELPMASPLGWVPVETRSEGEIPS